MTVTLAQAMVNAAADIDYTVIDDMRRYDTLLLDNFSWDDTANPTGGGTMIYGYNRLTQPAAAQTRALNTEYIPGTAKRSQVTANLKVWGAAFEIDRVLASLGQTTTNELNFQIQQAAIAVRMKFQEMVVLGDTAVDANGFDGLNKILTGTSTEANTSSALDISRGTAVDTQAEALLALDYIDQWLSSIYTSRVGSGQGSMTGAVPPGVRILAGNTASITRLKALMRWGASFTVNRDDLGRSITQYNGWTLVDLGDRNDGSGPIIPIGVSGTGETDIYAMSLGMDALHGAMLAGGQLVTVRLPDYTTAGAVKTGEIEMGPATIVLKSTKAAGAFRKLKVQ